MSPITFKKSWAIIFILALALSTIISGCFFPEEFNSKIAINKDGSFDFIFDGILTFVPAKAEEVKSGRLSAKLEKDLKGLEKELSEDPRYTKVKYIGHAQYKVTFKDRGRLDKPYHYFEKSDVQSNPILISILPQQNKQVKVTGIKLDENTMAQLRPLNMKVNGELNIKTNGKVIKHNAKSSPSIFGLFGTYNWKIQSINDPMPYITIQL